MDISTIGAQYMDSAYVPFSSSAPGSVRAGESGAFGEILKKAQQAQTKTESPLNNGIDKTSKLYELCVELETFLIKNLIKSMRNTVQKSDLVDTGFAGGIYEDMLYDEYAKVYARNANFGFAEMAYRELASYTD